jgi:TRAP-type mannitol/chloroaromatic compound transport system substrate-binding protein
MKKRLFIIPLVLVAVALIALPACQSAAPGGGAGSSEFPNLSMDKVEWRLQTYVTTGMSKWPELQDLCDRVETLSGGRFVITPYTAGGIVATNEIYDAVINRTVEFGITSPYYWEGVSQVATLFAGWPYGLSITEYYMWTDHAGGREIWQRMWGEFGLWVIPHQFSPTELGGWSKFQISSVADMKGKTFRLSGPAADIYSQVGVTPVRVTGGEVYSAMERGVLDIGEWSGPYDTWGMKFHEVAPYCFTPGWHQPATQDVSIVNMDAWNELPDDLKAILEEVVFGSRTRGTWRTEWKNAEYYQKYVDYGVTFTRLPQSDLDAFKPMVIALKQQYAAEDPQFKEVFEHQQAFLEQFRAYDDKAKVE